MNDDENSYRPWFGRQRMEPDARPCLRSVTASRNNVQPAMGKVPLGPMHLRLDPDRDDHDRKDEASPENERFCVLPAQSTKLDEISSLMMSFHSVSLSITESSPINMEMSWSTDEVHLSDPLSLSDYSDEICLYLREAEVRLRVKPQYMRKQQDLNHTMRTLLFDWMVDVSLEYKLEDETLHLAVGYVDRFLSCTSLPRRKLQLLGTCALYVAAKFQEMYPPDVNEFVYVTDHTYTMKQVLRMEHQLLYALRFYLAAPTGLCFLELYMQWHPLSNKARYLAMYLLELTFLDGECYLAYLPSVIAAAAYALSNCMTSMESWPPVLSKLAMYQTCDLEACLHDLVKSHRAVGCCTLKSLYTKYSTPKFLSVSQLPPLC
uniref:cyclin-A1-like n=1 Tax=Myxine glutinosa TaxID=7769 RepID=UPI00358F92B8